MSWCSDLQSGISENVAEAYGGGVLIYFNCKCDFFIYRPSYYKITFTSPYLPFNNYNSLQQVDNVATVTILDREFEDSGYIPIVNCPTGREMGIFWFNLHKFLSKDKSQLGFTTIDSDGRLKIENPNILVLPNFETQVTDMDAYHNPSQVCITCAIGQYKDTILAEMCTACPAGRYADALGSTDCTLCGEGKKSTIIKATNKSTCQACPPNTISVPSRIAW